MRHGSVFTGIGGLDLALGTPEWACDRDPYARRVLAARFPGVPCFDDVTTLSHPPAVDVLTGGFPCQDLSVAGKQAGVEGARSGLWRHMLRLTDELRPKVVVAENVANLGRQIGVIVRAFEAIGYRMAGPLNPAWCEAFMGFPIGWTDPESELTPAGWPMGQGPEQHDWEPPRMVAPRTVPNRGERIKCLGNAVVPQVGAVAAARVRTAMEAA